MNQPQAKDGASEETKPVHIHNNSQYPELCNRGNPATGAENVHSTAHGRFVRDGTEAAAFGQKHTCYNHRYPVTLCRSAAATEVLMYVRHKCTNLVVTLQRAANVSWEGPTTDTLLSKPRSYNAACCSLRD